MRSFKIIDHSESEKIIIDKKVEKEVKHGIPYATRKLYFIFHHSKKYLLPPQSNCFVRLKSVSHFISQNLEAIDHPVPERKNYDCYMEFSQKHP